MDDDTKPTTPGPVGLPTFDELEHGSLTEVAQNYRFAELKAISGILFAVGVLLIVFYSGLFVFSRPLVDKTFEEGLEALRVEGVKVDEPRVLEAARAEIRGRRILGGVMIGLGIVFCGLAFSVEKYPLYASSVGLGLFLAIQLAFALMDWTSLFSLIIFKALVIIALASAVHTARAYERARKKSRAAHG